MSLRPERLRTLAPWLGLFVALVAPGLILGARALGWAGEGWLTRILFLEIGLWTLVLILLLVIHRGEGRDLRSIGVGRPGWASLGWGVGAAVLVVAVTLAIAALLGLAPPSARQLESTGAIPLWLRLFMLVTAAGAEEILCRGYPITRLRELTGSRLLAAGLPLAVFLLYHFPFQGPGHILFVAVLGTVLTAAFLLRGDLWSNIVAHLALDTPFILLPLVTSRLAT